MHMENESQSIQYQSIAFGYISVSGLGQPSAYLDGCSDLADHPSLQWLQHSIFEVYHIGTFTENIYEWIYHVRCGSSGCLTLM